MISKNGDGDEVDDDNDNEVGGDECDQTWVPRLSSDVRAPLAVSQTLIRVPLLLAVANRVPAKMVAIIMMPTAPITDHMCHFETVEMTAEIISFPGRQNSPCVLRVIQARAESWAAMSRGAASVVAKSTFSASFTHFSNFFKM